MSIFGVSGSLLARLMQEHLFLSGSAILLALLLGLPMAVFAARNATIRTPLLAVVGIGQTIPGLALLALFYPLLLLIARSIGWPIPALGFLPALLALTVYALLPIVRNGVAAIRGVEPDVLEAADGLGMTGWQRLVHVELPLGAPVILAGIRIAAVWTIGTATLATTIGQASLGDLIFSGLQTEDWQRVLVGCVASALLAILVDTTLALVESGLALRRRLPWLAGVAMMAILFAITFLPVSLHAGRASGGAENTLIVGAKGFSEQYILAALIEDRLRQAGYRTERRDNLGSAVAYRALAAGDIDVYVDYGGTLWTNVLDRQDSPGAGQMLMTLTDELARRDDVRLLGELGFENAYAFAIKRERAQELGLETLDDLAAVAPQLRFATDLEFLNRPEWAAVRDAYGLRFAEARPFSPTFMYRAVADGSADVISAFSSDGRIAALDLATLIDTKQALPRYEAVLLVNGETAADEALLSTLRPLIGAIPIDTMREANWQVDRDTDKITAQAAAEWLEEQIISPAP